MFSLTGTPLAVVLFLLTVAGFVALVRYWSRLAAPGWRLATARTAALLGLNLLVLLNAGVQLNDQFSFFADWADLASAAGGGVASTALDRGGDAGKAAAQTVDGADAPTAQTQLQPLPPGGTESGAAPGWTLTRYTITGEKSRVTGTVDVALPPGYDPADTATAHPVLETFSGYPSTPLQWVRTMHLTDHLATALQGHALAAPLVVSPATEIPAGVDTECVDAGSGAPALETWLADDVPTWVQQHFRVAPTRAGWASIGLSSGGWCAAMVGLLHPARFGAAVVMGGYFKPEFGPGFDPFPPGSAAAQRYDLVALARKTPPPLALWVETSHADPVSYGSASALLRVARSPLAVEAVVLRNAGHRISVWEDLLPQALTWLGRTVPGFHPA